MNAKLNSAQQIAEFLGIKVDTLYHYARSGRIRAMKIGKAWKFSDDDLQSFLDSQRRSPAAQSPSPASPGLESPALVLGNEGIKAHDAEISYPRINVLASRLADRLQRAGVRAGDRVMVLMENSIEQVVSCFAAWKVGAVLLAEDPAVNADCMEQVLHDIAPSALILDRNLWEGLAESEPHFHGMKAVLIKGRGFLGSNRSDLNVESLDMILNNEVAATGYRRDLARRHGAIAMAAGG
jgi:excisionase family DNA binding protein